MVEGAAAADSSACINPLADPDVRLMLAVREGNAAAFEELMLRYQNRLVTVLEHLVGKRGQAEDLAQEVFLRVYRARERYQPASKFSTWLFTIANNVASNALRSRSMRREVQVAPRHPGGSNGMTIDELALAASGLMPARQLDKAELCAVVQAALDSLSERQRLAVLLNKFEQMSYADIAATMDLTPQAIKSLLSRARENLREALAPYLERGERPLAREADELP
ncbi:MAG TPA: sigma-70 family RNA polymerase sigma factor [Pirellulales bacterium]|nr:sigma-70 family RNA polymerase sigma factor [Pirellulales bacterium]